MIGERVNAGLARAPAQGKQLGRPRASAETEQRIRELLGAGMSMVKVGRQLGVGTSTVAR